MRMIAEEGCGVVVYLHSTSRGFEVSQVSESRPFDRLRAGSGAPSLFDASGTAALPGVSEAETGRIILHQELRAREGQQARTGRNLRAIGLGGQILSDLGIRRIRLLSNTPMHIPALEGFGLEIVEQVAIQLDQSAN
jgi:3,4-dihydroxy 2-butanone 4-phosphate synthase/GTP cyclohydrolase II